MSLEIQIMVTPMKVSLMQGPDLVDQADLRLRLAIKDRCFSCLEEEEKRAKHT